MSDALRRAIRADALEQAATDAWEHDHPATPWAQAPESVRAAMRALVAPTVESVLTHLDVRLLLDVDPEPDTFPDGTPFDEAVTRAHFDARRYGTTVRYAYKGTPLLAKPGDTWQDVAGRYCAAAEDAAR